MKRLLAFSATIVSITALASVASAAELQDGNAPKPGPDARVTFVRNEVEASTPNPHPAKHGEALGRGHKVSTLANSSAEVTFHDETRLQLGEDTLVIILGNSSTKAAVQMKSADTTLMKGSLRLHLGALAGAAPKTMPIATPGAKVDVGPGEAKLHVDDKSTTALAVHRGSSNLAAAGKKVIVNEGFGSKAELGKPPTPPKPLPTAPAFTAPIPALTLGLAATVDVVGTFAPATNPVGSPAVQWHLQLAREDKFNDLVVDAFVGVDVTKIEAKGLGPGTYHVRLSAVDADKLEGAFGPTQTFVVARGVVTPASSGKRATIEVGPGIFCGLDGAALTASGSPIELGPARMHVLRCAPTQDGQGQVELPLGTDLAGPVTLQTTFGDPKNDETGSTRTVNVKVLDAAGGPVSGVAVAAVADEGVQLSAFVESKESPGTYLATMRTAFGKAATLKLVVAGTVQAQTASAPAIDAPAPATAAVAPPAPFRIWESGLSLGVNTASHRFGPGIGLSIDLAWRRMVGSGLVFVGLRPGYERYSLGESHEVSCGAQSNDPHCTPDTLAYVQSLTADVFGIGIPIGYRLHASKAVSPYASITPHLLVARTHDRSGAGVTTSLRPTESSTVDATHTSFAFAAALGLAVQSGERANVLFEVGWRTARSFALPQGDGRLQGVSASVGFRYAF